MSVWDDLQEVRPEWVTLILSDGERYDAMDAKFFDDGRPYFNVSCESWRGAVLKGERTGNWQGFRPADGNALILLTHEVWEGDKKLEGTRVDVQVDWEDWLTRSGKAPA